MRDLTNNDKNPWVYVVTTVGLIVLIWFYFFVEVPYSNVSNAELFWASFTAFAALPIVFAWRYGWSGSNAGFNFMIMIGLIAISLGVTARWWTFLTPTVVAAIPGLFTGTILGVDGTFPLDERIFKNQGLRKRRRLLLGNQRW